MERLYVTVVARINREGDILPRILVFEDDREVEIDRRLQRPLRCESKEGDPAWRFPCLIEGRPVTLYHDPLTHRWWLQIRSEREARHG